MSSYAKGMEYELLVKSIYDAISEQKDMTNSKIERNIVINGASGVGHQIDILWSFNTNIKNKRILIECKNYSNPVSLGIARDFKSVLDDVGDCEGFIVTKVGFQKGAQKFCQHYNIATKVCRKPNDEDWKGRIRTITGEIAAKGIVSTNERPVVVTIVFEVADDVEKEQFAKDVNAGAIAVTLDPTSCFFDNDGNQISEELAFWIPRHVDCLSKTDGGPYQQAIELPNYYVHVQTNTGDSMLRKIRGVVVTYFVGTIHSEEFIINGENVVEAILKDTVTNELDFTKRIISLP